MARFIEKLTSLSVKKINTADCYGDGDGGDFGFALENQEPNLGYFVLI